MVLSDQSIKYPVFTTMVILALGVLGLVSLSFLGVELFPDVFPPVVIVTVEYPGASPEEIQKQIAQPIEDAASSLKGLKQVRSVSSMGLCQVIVEFTLETPLLEAPLRVNEAVSAIRPQLPRGISEPSIRRYDPSAAPIMLLGLSSEVVQPDELRRLAVEEVKPRLEALDGVGSVEVLGGIERQIQVLLDGESLAAKGLSTKQVMDRLAEENRSAPGGIILDRTGETLLRSRGEFDSLDDILEVVVTKKNGVPVYLRDIAILEDTFKDVRTVTTINRGKAVILSIHRQSGSNTVTVARRIQAELKKIGPTLPSGVQINALRDASTRILNSLRDVGNSLVLGAILAVAVVFLFMLDWRSTLIAALALPTSVIATFALLHVLGYSLNLMTLLGLSLAIGFLIDDSVVVRESIFRHLEAGLDPAAAARRGTAEVGLAVNATTFTIVAVFIPVAFMSGAVGRYYRQFGLTVAAAVLISLFVAFTLDPMLSSRFMRAVDKAERRRTRIGRLFAGWIDLYDRLDGGYRRSLEWVLAHRRRVLTIALVSFAASLALLPFIGREFLAAVDTGEVNIVIEMDPGTRMYDMVNATSVLFRSLMERPEVETVFTVIGSAFGGETNTATLGVKLKPLSQRRRSQEQIIADLRRSLPAIPGARLSFTGGGGVGMGSYQAPIEVFVRGPRLDMANRVASRVSSIVQGIKGTADVFASVQRGQPEYDVVVNRAKAADYGLGAGELAGLLRTMVEGGVATRYKEFDREYDVRVRLFPTQRDSNKTLENLLFITSQGKQVYLRDVASVVPATGPARIERVNRQRQVTVYAQVAGRPVGDVADEIRTGLAGLQLPPGYTVGFASDVARMEESFRALLGVLILSVIFIYMILASLFGSFLHPFTIMLALPLAIIGALVALLLAGMSINLMSLIGIVLLMGLVTKNAILLVDHIRVLRQGGASREEAVLRAAPIRLRPILMTTLAMIFGMLPVALGLGSEAEMRQPMAVAVIGGLITSTLLTLAVVPVVYTLIDERIERWRHRRTPVNP
jgi:HAE1 family hydrophobic/amphiphilic exporter-1